eukprot:GILK01012592.1.p1 GENE.GILK01012592.1~~GILK01012592.1.p1  ORF type:complete len:951 (-),score=120.80 GILK01012592.1:101-2953(-)
MQEKRSNIQIADLLRMPAVPLPPRASQQHVAAHASNSISMPSPSPSGTSLLSGLVSPQGSSAVDLKTLAPKPQTATVPSTVVPSVNTRPIISTVGTGTSSVTPDAPFVQIPSQPAPQRLEPEPVQLAVHPVVHRPVLPPHEPELVQRAVQMSVRLHHLMRGLHYELSWSNPNAKLTGQDRFEAVRGMIDVLFWRASSVISQQEVSVMYIEWLHAIGIDPQDFLHCTTTSAVAESQTMDYLRALDKSELELEAAMVALSDAINVVLASCRHPSLPVSSAWQDVADSIFCGLDGSRFGYVTADQLQFLMIALPLQHLRNESSSLQEFVRRLRLSTADLMQQMNPTEGAVTLSQFKKYLLLADVEESALQNLSTRLDQVRDVYEGVVSTDFLLDETDMSSATAFPSLWAHAVVRSVTKAELSDLKRFLICHGWRVACVTDSLRGTSVPNVNRLVVELLRAFASTSLVVLDLSLGIESIKRDPRYVAVAATVELYDALVDHLLQLMVIQYDGHTASLQSPKLQLPQKELSAIVSNEDLDLGARRDAIKRRKQQMKERNSSDLDDSSSPRRHSAPVAVSQVYEMRTDPFDDVTDNQARRGLDPSLTEQVSELHMEQRIHPTRSRSPRNGNGNDKVRRSSSRGSPVHNIPVQRSRSPIDPELELPSYAQPPAVPPRRNSAEHLSREGAVAGHTSSVPPGTIASASLDMLVQALVQASDKWVPQVIANLLNHQHLANQAGQPHAQGDTTSTSSVPAHVVQPSTTSTANLPQQSIQEVSFPTRPDYKRPDYQRPPLSVSLRSSLQSSFGSRFVNDDVPLGASPSAFSTPLRLPESFISAPPRSSTLQQAPTLTSRPSKTSALHHVPSNRNKTSIEGRSNAPSFPSSASGARVNVSSANAVSPVGASCIRPASMRVVPHKQVSSTGTRPTFRISHSRESALDLNSTTRLTKRSSSTKLV